MQRPQSKRTVIVCSNDRAQSSWEEPFGGDGDGNVDGDDDVVGDVVGDVVRDVVDDLVIDSSFGTGSVHDDDVDCDSDSDRDSVREVEPWSTDRETEGSFMSMDSSLVRVSIQCMVRMLTEKKQDMMERMDRNTK